MSSIGTIYQKDDFVKATPIDQGSKDVTYLPTTLKDLSHNDTKQSFSLAFQIHKQVTAKHFGFRHGTGWYYREPQDTTQDRTWYPDIGDHRINKYVSQVAARYGLSNTVNKIAELKFHLKHWATKHAHEWDSNPLVVGTGDGSLIDLRTGDAAIGANVTMRLGSRYEPLEYKTDGYPNRWHRFLDEVLPADTIEWFHLYCGYLLTGLMREEVLLALVGNKAWNGKTTLTTVLREITGDYATVIPSNKLMESDSTHTEWLADLVGKRMAFISELPEGRWKASLINGMVSGEPIRANKMRHDSFVFTPQCKLIILANELPEIPTSGLAGLRRRLHAIPMDTVFDQDSADRQLDDKLRAEYPGILAWMIEGAKAYLKAGKLPPVPASMKAETDSYTVAEDSRATWADENLIFDAAEFTPSSELYRDYRAAFPKSVTTLSGLIKWLKSHRACTAARKRISDSDNPNPVSGLQGVRLAI